MLSCKIEFTSLWERRFGLRRLFICFITENALRLTNRSAVEHAVSGDIEPQDAAIGCAQIRNSAVFGFDAMVQAS